jgi:hypothetical protein
MGFKPEFQRLHGCLCDEKLAVVLGRFIYRQALKVGATGTEDLELNEVRCRSTPKSL